MQCIHSDSIQLHHSPKVLISVLVVSGGCCPPLTRRRPFVNAPHYNAFPLLECVALTTCQVSNPSFSGN